jgi:hypothetical protein
MVDLQDIRPMLLCHLGALGAGDLSMLARTSVIMDILASVIVAELAQTTETLQPSERSAKLNHVRT